MASIKRSWASFCKRYAQFVEKQGFFIIMFACIGVIASTAVWTGHVNQSVPVPTPPVDNVSSAAQLQQESLRDVSTPTPVITAAPSIWRAPLDSLTVLHGFDASRLSQSAVTGLWELHDATDFQCEAGSLVYAIADGTVIETTEKGLDGATVTIDHGHDVIAYYAGMELLSAMQPGDPVEAGQTIGFGGNKMVGETDLGPHLHLRVTRGGNAIDPMLLLRQSR